MSLLLPLSGSAVRSMFTLEHLVEVSAPENRCKLQTLTSAKLGCIAQMRDAKGAIKGIVCFVLRANGELHLMRFGSRGGHKTLWNFGAL